MNKNFIINLLKLTFALALIFWLISSDKLHFEELNIYIARPDLLGMVVTTWTFSSALLVAYRWFLLLKGQDIDVSFGRVFKLNLIGLFFNTAMPGAVGGDVVKAIYVIRDQKNKPKTPAMLTVLLDRVIGLMGLFFIGAMAVLFNISEFWQSVSMRPVVIFIFCLLAAMFLFCSAVFLPFSSENDPILKFLQKPFPGFGLLRKIYSALIFYRQKPSALFFAFAISMFVQFWNLVLIFVITRALIPTEVDVMKFASVVPLGILLTALPVAPGGLGVGHVAFEKLFELIGLSNGANIFNVYILAILSLNLVGAIPYILIRKIKHQPNPATLVN